MLEEIDAGNPEALRKYLDSRSAEISDDVLMKVSAILRDVRENGDAALRKYTAQFDGVKVEDFRIKDEELQAAADQVSPSFKEAMEKAAANIRSFHEAQKQNSYLIEKDEGVYLGERVLPLSSCGIYVPGGRAQYPSSVLMNAIPAKVAGGEADCHGNSAVKGRQAQSGYCLCGKACRGG
jgi:histidinol dehydrogenase